VAIIQKYRYGLSEPCGSKNQINGVISIDIARLHPQAAGRRDKLKGLPPCCRQLKLNPVGAAAAAIMTSLNASEVQAMIAVKISDGDRQSRPERSCGDGLNSSALCDAVRRRN
jgi:hypothetical protein